MARNRQRARDRKDSQRRDSAPGPLDHASGEVDEVEAALVAGAARADQLDEELTAEEVDEELTDEELTAEEVQERADIEPEDVARGGGRGAVAARPSAKVGDRSGSRAINFLRACWAELQRVQWPDRRQVGQATAVVLGFVVLAGAFLGLADVVAQRIVDFII